MLFCIKGLFSTQTEIFSDKSVGKVLNGVVSGTDTPPDGSSERDNYLGSWDPQRETTSEIEIRNYVDTSQPRGLMSTCHVIIDPILHVARSLPTLPLDPIP